MSDQEIYDQFEYEDCSDCGQGADGHLAGVDPLGNKHAVCKEDAY
jgi:hypothetical protein